MEKNKLCFLFLVMAVGLGSAAGQTVSGVYPSPLFRWRCPQTVDSALGVPALFNHNPSVVLRDGSALVFDSLPVAGDYTLVVVYRPVADSESLLWRLSYSDSSLRGLTTERILSDGVSIRYADSTGRGPAIATLRQSAPDSANGTVRLTVGGEGTVDVAEVLYYGGRMGNAALRRVQSRLAVRYGVTLGPVDYLDSRGRHIWDYCDSGRYHHRVAGVGVDTLVHLSQLRSHSETDGAMLTVHSGNLADGIFLMTGDDDGATAFADSGAYEVLGRTWRAQFTGTSDTAEVPFTLVFNTRGMEPPTDSLVLLTADGVHPPSAVGGDSVVFTGVVFPAGASLFTLGRGTTLWQAMQTGNRSLVAGTLDFNAAVHPNPSNGHYTLEVSGAEHVQVTVYNMQGAAVASFSDGGRRHYRFEGDLPGGNIYFATVATESGSQTLKLVVK